MDKGTDHSVSQPPKYCALQVFEPCGQPLLESGKGIGLVKPFTTTNQSCRVVREPLISPTTFQADSGVFSKLSALHPVQDKWCNPRKNVAVPTRNGVGCLREHALIKHMWPLVQLRDGAWLTSINLPISSCQQSLKTQK